MCERYLTCGRLNKYILRQIAKNKDTKRTKQAKALFAVKHIGKNDIQRPVREQYSVDYSGLTQSEMQIVELKFHDNLKNVEIAKRLGVSGERIR